MRVLLARDFQRGDRVIRLGVYGSVVPSGDSYLIDAGEQGLVRVDARLTFPVSQRDSVYYAICPVKNGVRHVMLDEDKRPVTAENKLALQDYILSYAKEKSVGLWRFLLMCSDEQGHPFFQSQLLTWDKSAHRKAIFFRRESGELLTPNPYFGGGGYFMTNMKDAVEYAKGKATSGEKITLEDANHQRLQVVGSDKDNKKR